MSSTTRSQRRSAPKGKGGCSTCKLRHVRCNALKPRCSPCQKSSRQCEYSTDPDPDQIRVVFWQQNGLALRRLSPNPSYITEEARALDFFRDKVAINLNGLFDSSFWTYNILQVAQSESSVRHAIVALSSLSESMLKRTSNSASVQELLGVSTIQQHNKAISDLNQKIQECKELSMEVVLVMCCIFICFEMFQNNYDSALRQMSSGVYLFYNWNSEQNKENRMGHLSDIAIQLQKVFSRLMLQTILFIDTKPSEWKFLVPAFAPAIPRIPSAFDSIEEARDCLNNCMCFLYHAGLTSANQENGRQDLQTACQPLDEWILSFRSFMTAPDVKLSVTEQQGAIHLEIQYLTGFILASVGIFNQESVFDLFNDSFAQIVALASKLINGNGKNVRAEKRLCPTFDMGILPPLYFVTSRCRHPLIRRQALQLLRKGPRQEGIWECEMLSNIAERIIKIEEMGCADICGSEDIPVMARLSVLNAKIDSVQKMVTLHCSRQQFGALEAPFVLHELVKY